MAYIVMAYTVLAYIAMAYVVMAYVVMAYIAMAYVVMAYVVMAYIAMAYVVMACFASALIIEDVCARRERASVCVQIHHMFKPNVFAPCRRACAFLRAHIAALARSFVVTRRPHDGIDGTSLIKASWAITARRLSRHIGHQGHIGHRGIQAIKAIKACRSSQHTG